MNRRIFLLATVVALLPAMMVPIALLVAPWMTRQEAWSLSSTTIALAWGPTWVVIGAFVAERHHGITKE